MWPVVDHVEMPAVRPAGLQAFDDEGAMLFTALARLEIGGRFGQPLRKIRLEPAPSFEAHAQVAACLAVDPGRQVDPLHNFVRSLAVPGQVLAQVAVRFGRVITKAFQHVDAHLFGVFVDRVLGEELRQERDHIVPAPGNLDKPGLVVEPGGDHVHLAPVHFIVVRDKALALGPHLHAFGDFPMGTLHPVTQAKGFHPAIFIAGPGVHRHGIGVIQEQRPRFGHFADIFADTKQLGDRALGIHDPAGADGIAHALVDAIFQRDIDIQLESFQAALADHANHIIAILDSLPPVGGADNLSRQAVGLDVALAELGNHIQVHRVDIHEGEGRIGEFGDGQDIMHQAAREANRASANHGNFQWHAIAPFSIPVYKNV